jgi:uncharacterized protein (UPF0332 family)
VKSDRQALIAYRLERARETLAEARVLLEAGHANACVNRLYYACFYAVLALLLTRNIRTSKHTQVRASLHRDYVKPGHVPKKMGDHFDLLFDGRHRGDYEDLVVFAMKDVQPLLEPTKAFVEYIAELTTREMQREVP